MTENLESASQHNLEETARTGIELTPEQEDRVDHYMDHGFNYSEALIKAEVIDPHASGGPFSQIPQEALEPVPAIEEKQNPRSLGQHRKPPPLSGRMQARVDVRHGEIVHRPPFGYSKDD